MLLVVSDMSLSRFFKLEQIKLVTKTHLILFIFGCFVTLQTLHFRGYYDQSWSRSAVWSLVDWSAWFLLFSAVFGLGVDKKLYAISIDKRWPLLIILALSIPFAHALLTQIAYLALYPSERSLFGDVIHILSKRWFQNILTIGLLYYLFSSINKLGRNQIYTAA